MTGRLLDTAQRRLVRKWLKGIRAPRHALNVRVTAHPGGFQAYIDSDGDVRNGFTLVSSLGVGDALRMAADAIEEVEVR